MAAAAAAGRARAKIQVQTGANELTFHRANIIMKLSGLGRFGQFFVYNQELRRPVI